jgi:hypothetical protein
MATQKVSFKVAMDAEQKALKNLHLVALEVEMDVPLDILQKYALKAFVVELQGQIRPNWDNFIKGDYPKTLDLGHSLFAKKVSREITAEEKQAAYKTDVMSLTPEKRLLKMFEDKFITQEQYDSLMGK